MGDCILATMNKSQCLMGLFALVLIFDLALFVCACYACRGCYVDPCMEGDGVQDVWRINDGLGFQLVLTSLALFAHASHCVLLLNKGLNYSSFGYLTGSLLVFVVLLLGTAAHWTTISSVIMSDLKGEYQESGRESTVNESLKTAVEAISTFCFFETILYTAVLIGIQLWESELLSAPENTDGQHSAIAGPGPGSAYQSDYKMDGFPPAVNSQTGGIPPAVGTAGPPPLHSAGYQNSGSFAPAVSNTDFNSTEPARL